MIDYGWSCFLVGSMLGFEDTLIWGEVEVIFEGATIDARSNLQGRLLVSAFVCLRGTSP
jgi:hypothetical protein